MHNVFEGNGVQFFYPMHWGAEYSRDGSRACVELRAPNDAFVLVSVDAARPDPEDQVAEILGTLRGTFHDVFDRPASQFIDGWESIGSDIEIVSLDMLVCGLVRSFRTENRTVTVFAQWADLDEEDDLSEDVVQAILHSLVEIEDDPDDWNGPAPDDDD